MAKKGFKPVNKKISVITILVLSLGSGINTAWFTFQIFNTIDTGVRNGLQIESLFIDNVIEGSMLPVDAELAKSFVNCLKEIQDGRFSVQPDRGRTVLSFSGSGNLQNVARNKDSEKFSLYTPRHS
ncbi:MAG: hypothetical protein JXB03_08465, partial [Spirochaetales bacterium]|nr:hypothetical protein [Spirochaetales bacterium]